MNGEVLILKHVANEDAGTIKVFLKENDILFRAVDLYENEALPDALDGVRALVIMGGPMNVGEEDKHPFLKKENTFIQKALEEKLPCLGICLGSQLIAKALGCRVYKAPAKEVGWIDVRLTDETKKDPLFSLLNHPVTRVLQWHEDTFDLPRKAVLLASSDLVKHQAYRYGSHAYGLQFHIEVDRPMLEDWFKASPELPEILKEYDSYRPALEKMTKLLYQNFFASALKK